MGYVVVKFLGEVFQVSEAIKDFLEYDTLFIPAYKELMEMIMEDTEADSQLFWKNGDMGDHIEGTYEKYLSFVVNCVDMVIDKFAELGVYDVTADDLLNYVSATEELLKLRNSTFEFIIGEGYKIADMKSEEIDMAYDRAVSGITGSGVRVYSSSISSLIASAVAEKSVINSQTKDAERQFEAAVRNINSITDNSFDLLYRRTMISEFYPKARNIIMKFFNDMLSIFLTELDLHGKFDFESVKKYNKEKAVAMLKNIHRVPNKVDFLKQAFLICPFAEEIYEECLNLGLLDKETFETAVYFDLGYELEEKMDTYMRDNLENLDKVKEIVSILAPYRNETEAYIMRDLYLDYVGNIIGEYRKIKSAISSKVQLDSFVKNNVVDNMTEILDKSEDDINKIIETKLNKLMSQEKFDEFESIRIISAEDIKILNSSAVSLYDVNNEIKLALTEQIMEYIEEAKKRYVIYNRAKNLYEKKLNEMVANLKMLICEKDQLSLFEIPKRIKLSMKISNLTEDIEEFKRDKEPKALKENFERMYGENNSL